MARRNAQDYLELGDRLLHTGRSKQAARVYVRCADAWLGETFLNLAQELVKSDPVRALKVLAQMEKTVGPSTEGQRLTATAYRHLGQDEIANRFTAAAK